MTDDVKSPPLSGAPGVPGIPAGGLPGSGATDTGHSGHGSGGVQPVSNPSGIPGKPQRGRRRGQGRSCPRPRSGSQRHQEGLALRRVCGRARQSIDVPHAQRFVMCGWLPCCKEFLSRKPLAGLSVIITTGTIPARASLGRDDAGLERDGEGAERLRALRQPYSASVGVIMVNGRCSAKNALTPDG